MSGRTPTRRLINLLLPEGIDAFVEARRPDRAWRLIARDIYELTGEDITYETLRSWYLDLVDEGADDEPEDEDEALARSA